jgi:hypothetical protein
MGEVERGISEPPGPEMSDSLQRERLVRAIEDREVRNPRVSPIVAPVVRRSRYQEFWLDQVRRNE